MNKKEALDYIKLYQDNPPKPFKYYYHDPYDDGKYCGSGWHYEYPPMDPKLIDAILERDKDCKEYIPDCDCESDEKFNQEMEKRFTDLMSRAKDTAIDEWCKNNTHFYSMVTEYNYKKITIIPMSLSTLCDFKEKCKKASDEIGLKNFYIYEYKDDKDVGGKVIYSFSPYGGVYLSAHAKDTLEGMYSYCDYFKKYAKEYKSSNQELINNLCDDIKENVENLYNIIEADYLQRINNYIAKEQEQFGNKKL
jgi:hypothetical protein